MKFAFSLLAGVILAAGLTGCTATHDVAWPEARPLGQSLASYRPPSSNPVASPSDPVPDGTLTLREALAEALLQNPRLQAYAWEVRAREAATLQAGLRPNPEIGAEIEEFAGTGALSGLGAAQITGGLSQRIELGGDRRARRSVAAGERDLAGWDYEAVRLDVFTETAQAFTGVLAAQERLRLADSLLVLATEFAGAAEDRAEAGKVSPLEAIRAGVVRSTAAIARERADRELRAARVRLAASWGETEPAFGRAEGTIEDVLPVPDYQTVGALLERNPDVARWATEMALRRADLRLEQARRIPDPILTAGPSRYRETGEAAVTAGISIPLPLFDRNQGAIEAARARIAGGEAGRRAAYVEAQRALGAAYERLAAAFAEVTTLQTDVLPAARETFEATQEGYREGKFDLVTVLDAQRTLFEVTNQYVDALERYHTARADVERLIGTPLETLPNE